MIYYLSQKTVYYPKLYTISKKYDIITLSEIKLKGETMDNESVEQVFLTNEITDQLKRLYEIAAKLNAKNIKAALSFFETLLKK